MKHHTCHPGSRHTDCKETHHFQHRSKSCFAACAVTAVHDIVTCSDSTRSQINEKHIFSIIHSLRSQTKQFIKRSVQNQTDQHNAKCNCRTEYGKAFHILIPFHMITSPYFFSYHNGTCIRQSSKEGKHKSFQHTKRRHSRNRRFRLPSYYNVDQHLSNPIKQFITYDWKTFFHIFSRKTFPAKHGFYSYGDGMLIFQKKTGQNNQIHNTGNKCSYRRTCHTHFWHTKSSINQNPVQNEIRNQCSHGT